MVIANCFTMVMSDALMSDLTALWTHMGMYEWEREGAKRSLRCRRQHHSHCKRQQGHALRACNVGSCAATGTRTGTFINAIISMKGFLASNFRARRANNSKMKATSESFLLSVVMGPWLRH